MFELNLSDLSNGSPALRDRPIIFHGVNKSGSLSFAKALQKGYAAAGRTSSFMCRYLGIPETRDEALHRMVDDKGQNQILIDHGLVGLEERCPGAAFVTLLRHPARRIFSAYYWLQTYHPDQIMGRDFSSWLRTEGVSHSQMRQFAFNHLSPKERGEITRMKIGDMAARAVAFFDDKVRWFGITELFEESLLTFHWEAGLDKVAYWEADTRNKARPNYDPKGPSSGRFDFKMTSISNAFYDEIESVMGPDIVFYEFQRRKFLKYLEGFSIREVVDLYKKDA